MKVRRLPAAFLHSPRFVQRHGLQMLAHMFAGTNPRSLIGMEGEYAVFDRYRQRRRHDRETILSP